MRVHLGGDHAAYDLLGELITFLEAEGHEPVNHGPFAFDALDDYPVFVLRAAQAVAAEPDSLGIVLGGSGNGEQIAANKVAGVRAATVHDVTSARLAREHNDANVFCIGSRLVGHQVAVEALEAFLTAEFQGGRHSARVAKLDELPG